MNTEAYDQKGYLAADLLPEAANIFCLYRLLMFHFPSFTQFPFILFS